MKIITTIDTLPKDHSHPTNRSSPESSQPEQLHPQSDLLSAASDRHCNAVTEKSVSETKTGGKKLVSNQIKILLYYFLRYEYHTGQVPTPICARNQIGWTHTISVPASFSFFFFLPLSVIIFLFCLNVSTDVCRRAYVWQLRQQKVNVTLTTPLKSSSATLAATGYLAASFLS